MYNYYFNAVHPLRPYVYSDLANKNTLPPINALREAPETIPGKVACESHGKWIYIDEDELKKEQE